MFSTPVVSLDKVLVMTVDGTLRAFNLEDGIPVWTVAVDSNVHRWAMDGFSVSDELVFLPDDRACRGYSGEGWRKCLENFFKTP